MKVIAYDPYANSNPKLPEVQIEVWPNRIEENSISSNIAATIDILPTIAEIIGAKNLTSNIL